MEDEDEVLLAMAEELGNLIEHVGGNDHAHVLLLPLETLCAMEEALVRDKVSRPISLAPAGPRSLTPHRCAKPSGSVLHDRREVFVLMAGAVRGRLWNR